jgi:hypothetical protein
MSDDKDGKGSEASPTVKEHARKMLAKLRAKLSGKHALSSLTGQETFGATCAPLR